MDEKYDLKWKTYPDHLVGVFKELGEEGNFADVTLVGEENSVRPEVCSTSRTNFSLILKWSNKLLMSANQL